MNPVVQRLQPGEGDRWRELRLRALTEAPAAFSTKLAEASTWPSTTWAQQLVECATFVAVLDGVDVGVARGSRHAQRSDARTLISMWVAPTARRHGIASLLIDVVATWAQAEGAALLVLGAVANNHAAIACYTRAGFEPCTDASLVDPDPCEVTLVKRLATAG